MKWHCNYFDNKVVMVWETQEQNIYNEKEGGKKEGKLAKTTKCEIKLKKRIVNQHKTIFTFPKML